MKRGDLFHRLFVRFLVALGVAMALLVMLFHTFQRQIIFSEWQQDLSQDAFWLARHAQNVDPDLMVELARAWGSTHHGVHLRVFDAEGTIVANSHPDRSAPDLAAARAGSPFGHLVAVEPLSAGRTLVFSRRWTPGFPAGHHGELLVAAIVLAGLVALLLFPFVRSLSRDLRRLQATADAVSAGQLGRTAEIERSDELGELGHAFDAMSTRLAEAERSNTRLLHDVSHELRSPLGRIRVLADSISARPNEADACLDGIREEVALLDRLVGDLLDTARLEATPHVNESVEIELRSWGEDLASRLGREPTARGIHWRVELPDRTARIHGDPQRLAQAAANLVDNAMAAVAETDAPTIGLAIAVDGERWRLTVDDDGRGIPADDLPHVTRRFYRVDHARSRSSDGGAGAGVGLGLALVKAITEAHDGELTIDSRSDEGTRVCLELPATPQR